MAEVNTAKRLKTSNQAWLASTHGHFQTDETLTVYLLRLLPACNPSTFLRTRDPSLFSTCHTVVDVGGEYSPSAHRYDHHQRTFTTTFPSHTTKLSSAGLIYLHFGKSIIEQHLCQSNPTAQEPEVDVLWEKLDEKIGLGVEGGVFVHASGFIGGSRTEEVARRMAQKAVEL